MKKFLAQGRNLPRKYAQIASWEILLLMRAFANGLILDDSNMISTEVVCLEEVWS